MRIRRRQFITLVGGAATWPLAARAQQQAMPVIGYLSAGTPKYAEPLLAAFRQALSKAGFIENKNVVIQYRFADGQYDRLPAMATDLVRRQVTVIVAGGGTQSAAKAATTTIPIVFTTATDPVQTGLVASLSRPGGNLTGVTNLNVEVGPKLLELLHELVPAANSFGLLVNPRTPGVEESVLRQLQPAARTFGLRFLVLHASTEQELDAVFANLADVPPSALMIEPDPFFTGQSEQLAALTLHHGMPAAYQFRQFSAAGGLMSYGGSTTESSRIAGVYTGRILKGEKPADLPVQQSTKVELVINLKTAKALGLTVPLALLTRADEVIE
jgi:putative tryptophan/tyrosine transport system substrate-binding protein